MLGFYFARRWQSLVTIFYFAIFAYFSLFYIGNLWLTLKFIFYTVGNSGALLGIPYLLWGVAFLLALLIPFAASIYALILFYEMWVGPWEFGHKMLATLAIMLAALLIILFADEAIRLIARQNELREFVRSNNLHL